MDARMAHNHLQEKLKPLGYHKRGREFFKLQGDGVLILIKLGYERCGSLYDLKLGLYSMYQDLEFDFLLKGWGLRYGALQLYDPYYLRPIGAVKKGAWWVIEDPVLEEKRFPVSESFGDIADGTMTLLGWRYPVRDLQWVIETFTTHVLPLLEQIKTQEELYEMDRRAEDLDDCLKIDLLLVFGRNSDAMEVVQKLLSQSRDIMTEKGIAPENWADSAYYAKLLGYEKLILEETGIPAYLRENFERNTESFNNAFSKKRKKQSD